MITLIYYKQRTDHIFKMDTNLFTQSKQEKLTKMTSLQKIQRLMSILKKIKIFKCNSMHWYLT